MAALGKEYENAIFNGLNNSNGYIVLRELDIKRTYGDDKSGVDLMVYKNINDTIVYIQCKWTKQKCAISSVAHFINSVKGLPQGQKVIAIFASQSQLTGPGYQSFSNNSTDRLLFKNINETVMDTNVSMVISEINAILTASLQHRDAVSTRISIPFNTRIDPTKANISETINNNDVNKTEIEYIEIQSGIIPQEIVEKYKHLLTPDVNRSFCAVSNGSMRNMGMPCKINLKTMKCTSI